MDRGPFPEKWPTQSAWQRAKIQGAEFYKTMTIALSPTG
jgi:hypothetical protein